MEGGAAEAEEAGRDVGYCGTQRAIAGRKGLLRDAKGYCGTQRVKHPDFGILGVRLLTRVFQNLE